MEKGKWISRGGMLTVILGFFMPTVLVSCSGMSTGSQAFSLADLAGQAQMGGLYLLLVAAIAVIGVSFVRVSDPRQAMYFLWGQLAAVVISAILVMIMLLNLSSKVSSGTGSLMTVEPAFGAFILVAGLIAFGIGWFMQFRDSSTPVVQIDYGGTYGVPDVPHGYVEDLPPTFNPPGPPLPDSNRGYNPGGMPSLAPARLEMVKGNLPGHTISVTCDNFTIGRSSENLLRISDPTVSRHHARLRLANGAWFIQDAGSTTGIYVNGQRVSATRLNYGDQITLGGHEFIFYDRN